MKKTLLAATSLLALAAFGAQAAEETKAEATKEAVKTEATAEAGKTEATTATEAAPAAGEAKKEEHKDHKKEEHK